MADTNYVKLVGKIAGEIYFSMAKGGTLPLAKFKVAVQQEGRQYPDKFSCVAFRENAESISMLTDGAPIALIGELKNGSYVGKDGTKKYTTDVVLTRIDSTAPAKKPWGKQPDGAGPTPPDDDPPF